MKYALKAWLWKVTFMNNDLIANPSVVTCFWWLTSTKYMFSFMIICIYTWRHEITRKVAYDNETCDNKQMLQMFQTNVSIVNACLWMRDDRAHVMQVKLCKANTQGVTAPPPYKNVVPRFARPTILWKRQDKLLVNNLLFPT